MSAFDFLMWVMFAVAGLGAVLMSTLTIRDYLKRRRARRTARIEADLDRTSAELRQTILRLAEAIGTDAHEARKALIRESFLASGSISGRTRSPDQN